MDFILGLILSWPAMIVLIIIAIGFEHNRAHGWTVIATLMLGGIAYMVFGLTWQEGLMVAGAWIPIGVIWSFWRWKRHVSRIVDEYDPDKSSGWGGSDYDRAKRQIDPTENVDTISYWVIAWPFSVVEMLLGDIIDVIQSLVKSVFRGTYAKISAKGLATLEQKHK